MTRPARTRIELTLVSAGEPLLYDVFVEEPDGGQSRHKISVAAADLAHYGCSGDAERLVEAAFRFLLDREPKETILKRFDLSVISQYFPEFQHELPKYLRDDPRPLE